MSQKKKVISWLKSGRTLTPREAYFNDMGMRLGAIIWVLRDEGMNIRNLNKSGKDRHAEYKLIPEKPKEEPEPSLELGNTNRFRYPD